MVKGPIRKWLIILLVKVDLGYTEVGLNLPVSIFRQFWRNEKVRVKVFLMSDPFRIRLEPGSAELRDLLELGKLTITFGGNSPFEMRKQIKPAEFNLRFR